MRSADVSETPADALDALGLSSSLLSERRGEDRHRRHADDDLAPMHEEMPPERMSVSEAEEHAEDEEEDWESALADYLRSRHNFTDDEIEEAKAEFAKDVRKRRANGRDRERRADDRHADDKRRAKDVFPHNRVRGSEREPPSAGHFGGARRSGDSPTGNDDFQIPPDANGEGKYLVDHGLDTRRRFAHDRGLQEVKRVHELMRRFGPEVGARPDRSRYAMDAKRLGPSEARKEKLFKRFPDMARIGTPSEDGRRDPMRRSQYEV